MFRGSWFMVHGPWFMVHGSPFMAHGSLLLVPGSWIMSHCHWLTARGPYCVAHGEERSSASVRTRAMKHAIFEPRTMNQKPWATNFSQSSNEAKHSLENAKGELIIIAILEQSNKGHIFQNIVAMPCKGADQRTDMQGRERESGRGEGQSELVLRSL